jgi:hypothetical protein
VSPRPHVRETEEESDRSSVVGGSLGRDRRDGGRSGRPAGRPAGGREDLSNSISRTADARDACQPLDRGGGPIHTVCSSHGVAARVYQIFSQAALLSPSPHLSRQSNNHHPPPLRRRRASPPPPTRSSTIYLAVLIWILFRIWKASPQAPNPRQGSQPPSRRPRRCRASPRRAASPYARSTATSVRTRDPLFPRSRRPLAPHPANPSRIWPSVSQLWRTPCRRTAPRRPTGTSWSVHLHLDP